MTDEQSQIGLHDVEVVKSGFEEDLDQTYLTPFEYVMETARHKCLKCYEKVLDDEEPPYLVIAADTIVLAGSKILEKPKSPDDNLHMLQLLRDLDTPQQVCTAIAVLTPMAEPVAPGYVLELQYEETKVFFEKSLDDDFLAAYVRTGESNDAAGGYCIQVKAIEGDYFNVMGLPLRTLLETMEEALSKARLGQAAPHAAEDHRFI